MNRIKSIFLMAILAIGTMAEAQVTAPLYKTNAGVNQSAQGMMCLTSAGTECSFGGSGGGAATIADGADVAQGSRADTAWVSGSGTIIAINKALVAAQLATNALLPASIGTKTAAGSLSVVLASDGTLPLPTGAATLAAQSTGNTSLSSIDSKLTGPLVVVGSVNSGATDSGAPVKAGGKYNLTPITLTDGQRGDFQLTPGGTLLVTMASNTGSVFSALADNADSVAVSASSKQAALSRMTYYNGTTWDRARGDTNGAYMTIAPTTAAVSAIVPSISASAAATSLIAKASAGNYYDGYCQASAAGRCILYNATTVPSAGALTASLVLECVTVPAGGQGSWSYGAQPRRASVGIILLYSSGADCNTYTVSSTAYIHASVQ